VGPRGGSSGGTGRHVGHVEHGGSAAKGVPSRDMLSSQLPDQVARAGALSKREAGSGAASRQVETGLLAAVRRGWRTPVTVMSVTGVSAGFVGLVTWLAPLSERAGAAAAAAAIATLAVVAWQSVIAGRATVAAEHGLATATRALDEAERGRLDQQGPQS
jgi:hypothetical protein